jgi:hypothetical protein
MKIGDKIKTFEVKEIVERYKKVYNDKGDFVRVLTQYAFLLSVDGQQRVLEVGKSKLNECVMTYTTWSKSKYITWNQI